MQRLLGVYKIHPVSNHSSPALRVTGCSVPSQQPFGVKVRSTPWTSRQFITGPAQQTNTHMLARSLMLDGWKLKYPVLGRANCMQKQLMVTELSQLPSTIKDILHLVIRLAGLFPESICHFGQNKQRRQMNEICKILLESLLDCATIHLTSPLIIPTQLPSSGPLHIPSTFFLHLFPLCFFFSLRNSASFKMLTTPTNGPVGSILVAICVRLP